MVQAKVAADWYGGANPLGYAYDNAGRLTRITDYDSSTLTYAYDAAGNVTTMTDYHGSVFSYTYYDDGRLSTLTAPGSKTWNYTYNALGQVSTVSIPNGMTTEYGYDSRNRLTQIAHKDGSTTLDGWTYALTAGSNITRTTNADGSYWDYAYDGRDRLTKAERRDSGGSLLHRYTYTYSTADNMTTKEVYTAATNTTETTAFAYNAGNELTSQTLGATTTTFGYDAWGNMTSKGNGTYSASYDWHYGGKLTGVTSSFPGEGTVTYGYGGDGKRRERNDGTLTKYNWSARWGLLNEKDSAGNLQVTHVGSLARIEGSMPTAGFYAYYATDRNGSVRSTWSTARTNLDNYEYDPFGSLYSSSGGIILNGFNTSLHDALADLYFMPLRVYDAGLARWLSRDPLLSPPYNLYEYSNSSPVTFRDVTGGRPDKEGERGGPGLLTLGKGCSDTKGWYRVLDKGDKKDPEHWTPLPLPEYKKGQGGLSLDFLYGPGGRAVKIRNGMTCVMTCNKSGAPAKLKCEYRKWPLSWVGPDCRGPEEDDNLPGHPETGKPPTETWPDVPGTEIDLNE